MKGLRLLQTFVKVQLLFHSNKFLINEFLFIKEAQRIELNRVELILPGEV